MRLKEDSSPAAFERGFESRRVFLQKIVEAGGGEKRLRHALSRRAEAERERVGKCEGLNVLLFHVFDFHLDILVARARAAELPLRATSAAVHFRSLSRSVFSDTDVN